MMYKIKDKVRIKSIDWYNAQPKDDDGDIDNIISFVKDMVDLCGQVGVVIEVYPPDKLYRINFKEKGSWWFSDDWIEPEKYKDRFNFNLYKPFKFDKYV